MVRATVLIVDDHPVNVELAKLVLLLEGYVVHTAHDARTCEAMLEDLQPDLILMDVRLPDVDGLDLTRRIRTNPRHRDTVIVAFTAHAMKGDQENALAAGCNGYLTKPIDTRAFPSDIARYLRMRPSQHEDAT